jgi:flagellar L-ring protein precursor FlgH
MNKYTPAPDGGPAAGRLRDHHAADGGAPADDGAAGTAHCDRPQQRRHFQRRLARPLFEDRRARFVGDTLTSTSRKRSRPRRSRKTRPPAAGRRRQRADHRRPAVQGRAGHHAAASDTNNFNGKGENTSSNDFTGTLTVTVIEVYPNGNLLVSGEKQIGLKEGEEFVRFSGVVNPNTITAANTVTSTQVADARIEYKANGFLDSAQVMGWLGRFFLTVLPF